jgi:hypothetical protein
MLSARTFEAMHSAQPGEAMRFAQFGKVSRALLVVTLLSACAAAGATSDGSAQKTRQPDFLVYATVYNDRGFTVPNARARMSVAGENKWRWETTSDGQGEFALHVPEGAQYDLRVDAKGYESLTQGVDATQTDRDDLGLHLVPLGGGKSE